MKRLVVALVAVIATASLASAQRAQLGVAGGVAFGSGTALNLHANIASPFLADLSRNAWLGVRGNLDVLFAGGGTGVAVSAGPVFTFNVDALDIYAHPNIGAAFGGGDAALVLGATTGIAVPLNRNLEAFGEVPVAYTLGANTFGVGVRGGLNFRL